MWLRKKTPNLPTRCRSCRLNPHDQLGRLCVYGMYKRTLRVPAKENALVLIAVDIGGKNPQEDQIRIWAAPTAGPETSTVLEGILGRWGGLVTPREGKDSESSDSRKTHYSYVLTCSVDSFGIFFFFPPFPLSVGVVCFTGTMKCN